MPHYPFAAIAGQDEMKLALLLAAVDSGIGGVMVMGHRGTGKSTTVRAMAGVIPRIRTVVDCAFNCDPEAPAGLCDRCTDIERTHLVSHQVDVPVIDLPLGATEDRVAGTIDIEHALVRGEKLFEPGLLARANRGFLYIDEVNLLEDHLVDLLLDVAASGVNIVEREGMSVRHPSHFALVGSGNPEEGELRPQLLDRFGLSAYIRTEMDVDQRVEIVRRRMAFDDKPEAFISQWEGETSRIRKQIAAARKTLPNVRIDDDLMRTIARLSIELDIDGHRGELVATRAARAHAALDGRRSVSPEDVRVVAPMALRHRLRKDPLEMSDHDRRVENAVARIL